MNYGKQLNGKKLKKTKTTNFFALSIKHLF